MAAGSVTVRELVTKWGFKADLGKVKQFTKAISGAKATAKNLGIVLAGAGVAVGFFAKRAGEIEQVNVAFETMLGSAERAKELFNDLTDFAAKTPFELRGIFGTSKQLLGMGIEVDKLLPTLKSLGDVSAGLSVPLARLALNFGQIKAQGKLTGRDMRDFMVSGVPIAAELAKNMNVAEEAIADMVSAGKVKFKDVEAAFLSMTSGSGRFSDLMTKQSATFLGMMSNIKDAIDVIAFEIGFELLPNMKKLAIKMIDFLDINKKVISQKMGKFFKEIVDTVMDVIDSLGGLENALKTAAIAFAVLFAVWKPGIVAAGIFLVLLQDYIAALKGHKSFLGTLHDIYANWFNMVAKGINMIIRMWNKIPRGLKPFAGLVFGPLGAVRGVKDVFKNKEIPTLPEYDQDQMLQDRGVKGYIAHDGGGFTTEMTLNVTGLTSEDQVNRVEAVVAEKMDEAARTVKRSLESRFDN